MQVSSSSSSAQASQAWAMQALRQAAASSASQGSGSVSKDFASVARQGGDSGRGGPPPGPPPDGGGAESSAMSGLSTMQFAAMGAGGGPPQDPIASLDSDGDGSVSGSEFGLDSASASDESKQLFKAIDSSGDGAISSDELTAMRDKMMAAHQAARPPADPIASLDSDGNGSVSGSEFGVDSASASDESKQLFKAIDSSGDGSLSRDEITAMGDKMKAAHEAGWASASQGSDGTQAAQRPSAPHGGPPPGAAMGGDQGGGASSTTTFDAKAMIQKLSQHYAEFTASQTVNSAFSATA